MTLERLRELCLSLPGATEQILSRRCNPEVPHHAHLLVLEGVVVVQIQPGSCAMGRMPGESLAKGG